MRALLAVLVTLAAGALAACTFPDVDYGGGGSDGGPLTTCAVPSMCADNAMPCADQVAHDDESCRKPCQSDSACLASCDASRQSALGACAAACESCGAPTCGSQPMNCKALVGL